MFEKPVAEIVRFEVEDIITTSVTDVCPYDSGEEF